MLVYYSGVHSYVFCSVYVVFLLQTWETKDCVRNVSIGRLKRIYQCDHFLSLVFKCEMRTGEAEIGHRSQQVLELEFGFKSTDLQCGLFALP